MLSSPICPRLWFLHLKLLLLATKYERLLQFRTGQSFLSSVDRFRLLPWHWRIPRPRRQVWLQPSVLFRIRFVSFRFVQSSKKAWNALMNENMVCASPIRIFHLWDLVWKLSNRLMAPQAALPGLLCHCTKDPRRHLVGCRLKTW